MNVILKLITVVLLIKESSLRKIKTITINANLKKILPNSFFPKPFRIIKKKAYSLKITKINLKIKTTETNKLEKPLITFKH